MEQVKCVIGTYDGNNVTINHLSEGGCGWYVSYTVFAQKWDGDLYLHKGGNWCGHTGGSGGDGYYATREEAVALYEKMVLNSLSWSHEHNATIANFMQPRQTESVNDEGLEVSAVDKAFAAAMKSI